MSYPCSTFTGPEVPVQGGSAAGVVHRVVLVGVAGEGAAAGAGAGPVADLQVPAQRGAGVAAAGVTGEPLGVGLRRGVLAGEVGDHRRPGAEPGGVAGQLVEQGGGDL